MAKKTDSIQVEEKAHPGEKPDPKPVKWKPSPVHTKTVQVKGKVLSESTDDYVLVNQVARGGKTYACHRSRSNPKQFVVLCDGVEVSTQGTLKQTWEKICRS